ncbi:hypothetical protein NB706_001689 [Xanthomonas sacchari]|nr:hypothetical protein [Xanthomonas sacchari]
MFVVDPLEVVEVDHRHCQRGLLGVAAAHLRRQRLEDAGAVEQAGEGVVRGLHRQCGAGDLQFALVVFQLLGAPRHQLGQFALALVQAAFAPVQQGHRQAAAEHQVQRDHRLAAPPHRRHRERHPQRRRGAAPVGVQQLHLQHVVTRRQRRLLELEVGRVQPAGVCALEAIAEADAVALVVQVRRADRDMQRILAPVQARARGDGCAGTAELLERQPWRLRREQPRRIQQMGDATAAAQPYRAVVVFQEGRFGHVVPEQPLCLRQPRPGASVVDVHALVVADPDPSVAGAAQAVQLQAAQLRIGRLQVQGVAVEPPLPGTGAIQAGPGLAIVQDQQFAEHGLRRRTIHDQPDRRPGLATQSEHAGHAHRQHAAVATLLDVRILATGQRLHLLRHRVGVGRRQQIHPAVAEDPHPAARIHEQLFGDAVQRRVGAQQPALRVVSAQRTDRADAPQRAVRGAL